MAEPHHPAPPVPQVHEGHERGDHEQGHDVHQAHPPLLGRHRDAVLAALGPCAGADVLHVHADAAPGRVILTYDQPFTNHNGGLLLFGPDDLLYIGTGDGGRIFLLNKRDGIVREIVP